MSNRDSWCNFSKWDPEFDDLKVIWSLCQFTFQKNQLKEIEKKLVFFQSYRGIFHHPQIFSCRYIYIPRRFNLQNIHHHWHIHALFILYIWIIPTKLIKREYNLNFLFEVGKYPTILQLAQSQEQNSYNCNTLDFLFVIYL